MSKKTFSLSGQFKMKVSQILIVFAVCFFISEVVSAQNQITTSERELYQQSENFSREGFLHRPFERSEYQLSQKLLPQFSKSLQETVRVQSTRVGLMLRSTLESQKGEEIFAQ